MNQGTGNMTDELLVKYLLGEADANEIAKVQHWIDDKEDNKKYFEHFKLIWEHSKELAAKSSVDENAAWARFQQRVAKAEEQPLARTIPLNRYFGGWMRVAAILILMIGGGWFYYYNFANRMLTLSSNEIVLTQTLPDGTLVTLNKHSSIHYPKRFKGNTRAVELEGEAFFDVAHDKSKPFIITADEASIKVVGTSFNVKTSAAKTEVIVETGIVEVSKQSAMVRLKPKEKATVTRGNEAPVKETIHDELYSYYRTKEFICNATPLYKLVDVLNEAYGSHIVIKDEQLKQMQLNTTFHNESLDGILSVITGTFNIKAEKQGDTILLKP